MRTLPSLNYEKVWEELHEFFAKLTLLLVAIHILGVAVESYIHKENLVKSMTNGFKNLPPAK
ncbi:MAG: cytochrome b/b6 domain-containing protein [Methylococcaceae bacterium]